MNALTTSPLRVGAVGAVMVLTLLLSRTSAAPAAPAGRTFATADEAVRSLASVVKAGDMSALLAIFGPDGEDLVSTSDPATGRRHQEVFLAAFAERWRLVDTGRDRKELVIGNEDWPFPVPLVKGATGWFFDTAAGKEEVLARRIGRNELAVIGVCRTYALAQRAYAAQGRDGRPAGVYARRLRSTAGTHDGLYWAAAHGEPRSPLGDLVAGAANDGTDLATARTDRVPFHGYYFRILEGQGPHATGGAADYVVNGHMTGGFALVAWPATYDATGVMTFLVGKDGIVYERDLGPDTATAAAAITRYDPDASWRRVEVRGAAGR